MTASAHFQRPTVIEMSAAEWKEAVQRALDKLQLTYSQLAEMAQRRDFSSLDAKKLWLAIGEQEPGRPGRLVFRAGPDLSAAD
jgi:hypothetical protein